MSLIRVNIEKVVIQVMDDEKQNLIIQKLEQIMTKQERFDAILSRMDSVTTNLAADFSAFVEEARTGTVSDESLAKAEANIATLEQLAASKENPVPGEEIPPAEEPTPGEGEGGIV